MTKRQLLVTSALPYANGHLHLGHMVEHVQCDIWVRTHRMLGIDCISICGDDAHGTPIMLKAEQQGITPEALTDAIRQSHEQDFHAYGIFYDCYHSTHSPENEQLSQAIYQTLEKNQDIIKKTIQQAYDESKSMFLPDRFIKGTCPKCKTADQYGDSCESCGATYAPTELINPVSALSGTTPIQKESLHYFFDLPKYENFLKDWTTSGVLQSEVANKLAEWFEQGLKDWDISRDAPYFGFKIPGADDKYFYVWLDAPIGYMASFKKYSGNTGTDFNHYWGKNSTTELYHFVGKDIMYFHALFWPAILNGAGFRLPSGIFTHGFLTVNGQKMSKSRGTFIQAKQFAKHINPTAIRYYFAAKLNGGVEDIDLNLEDFVQRVNADLVGKIINIASRSAGFINKKFENQLSDTQHNQALFDKLCDAKNDIFEAFIARDYAKALRQIMALADEVNQYIDAEKPWSLAKEVDKLAEVQAICTQALNLYRVLIGYLKPIIPEIAEASEKFLNCEAITAENITSPLLGHSIHTFSPLMQRIDPAQIQAMLEEPQVA
jgi:methionyl-tRNA synthetase